MEQLEHQGNNSADLTLVELLARQKIGAEAGLRLSLHPNLVEPLGLHNWHTQFVAASGNIPLALFLYSHGIWNNTQLTVASLSSGGATGDSPWSKPVAVTCVDVARLAGKPRVAEVLSLIEQSVPLRWTPAGHAAYPRAFRTQAAQIINSLCSAGWFIQLPGTARTAITGWLMQDLARTTVWGMVQPEEWEAAEQGDFGVLNEHVQELLSMHKSDEGSKTDDSQLTDQRGAEEQGDENNDQNLQQPGQQQGLGGRQFQFRLSYTNRTRRGNSSWPFMLLPGAVAAVAACLCKPPQRTILLAYVAGAFAGVGFTLPGATLLLANLLGTL